MIIFNLIYRTLSRSLPYSKLTKLNVTYNRFSNEGAIELLYIAKSLKRLQMYGNKIGHETGQVRRKLRHNTNINFEILITFADSGQTHKSKVD